MSDFRNMHTSSKLAPQTLLNPVNQCIVRQLGKLEDILKKAHQ